MCLVLSQTIPFMVHALPTRITVSLIIQLRQTERPIYMKFQHVDMIIKDIKILVTLIRILYLMLKAWYLDEQDI